MAFRARYRWIIGVVLAVAGVAWVYRPDLAIRSGVAMTSQTLCDEVFVGGLDGAQVFEEEIRPQRGMRILLRWLHYSIDAPHWQVKTTWAGGFDSVATYRRGYGCTLGAARGELPDVSAAGPATNLAGPAEPIDIKLEEALDRAFAEPIAPPYRRVRAIVVVRDGKVVAERYAQGIKPETPLLAYSVSKSVINALVGILVGDGKLEVDAPAPVPAWHDAGDPRRAITLDQLLRMTSGLALEETSSGFDPVSRMLFWQHDMAAFAEQAGLKAKPGTAWEYTSGNTLIAAAIVRRAVGGRAEDVLRFASRRLFDPLGMQHMTMEFDDAGTPIGATRMLATARDWARFGQLYLDDGVVNGRRILPQGWVAYSTRPTLDSAYGAGFWVNAGHNENALGRVQAGMPTDAFFASGNFGQRIVVIPSQRLVIVRLGVTVDPPEFDIRGLTRLVREVIAAR